MMTKTKDRSMANYEIKRKDVEQVHEMTRELDELKKEASDLLKKAQDSDGKKTVRLTRKGEEVDIEQSNLWTEVFHMSADCEAGKELKKLHPAVFEAYEKVERGALELKAHIIDNFGFDFSAMTISDYIRLTEGLIQLRCGKK